MDFLKIQIPRSTQTVAVVARSVETSIESDLLENSDDFHENNSSLKIKSIESINDVATQTDFNLQVSNFQLQPIVQPSSQYLLPHLISSKLLAVAGTLDFRQKKTTVLIIYRICIFVDVKK